MWNRRFKAIDGEALAGEYCLLGTDADYLYKSAGRLHTDECLDFLGFLAGKFPESYWIGYGIHYDVNNILRDLCPPLKTEIFNAGEITRTDGLRIKYLPKKLFSLRWPLGAKLEWYDAIGFCQGSFVDAYRRITGKKPPGFVVEGKTDRGSFARKDFLKVLKYNQKECELLIEMMLDLDGLLQSENIRLRKWYGASCIADHLLRSINAQNFTQYYYPSDMMHAFKCAYFGGRIEALKLGSFREVWNYDINSAYPAETAKLPLLGEWRRAEIGDLVTRYPVSVWKVKFESESTIGPLPWRRADGSIYFPQSGVGWYWQPEIIAASDYAGITILDGYVCNAELDVRPFENLIEEIYARRNNLKHSGNRAELVLKLGINALYGKLAQHTGKPRFFNLPYAGIITSNVRSRLFSTAMENRECIIGFATDAILTTEPLKLSLTSNLGDWSESKYDSATVIMPGVYRLDGETVSKLRRRGFAHWDWLEVMRGLNETGSASIQQNQFITWKIADQMKYAYGPHYCQFIKAQREITPRNLDKRVYEFDKIKNWDVDNCGSKLIPGSSKESAEIDWTPVDTFESEVDYIGEH